jgi:hypothetical protein
VRSYVTIRVCTEDRLQQHRQKFFEARCQELALRHQAGEIKFIDAIDMAYQAAVWSGLVDDIGDDTVQRVMADSFARRAP